MKKLLLLATLVASYSAFAGTIQKSLVPAMQKDLILNQAPTQNLAKTRASSGSIDFTYAGEPYWAFWVEDDAVVRGKTRIYLMFEMLPEDIKSCAGNEVTGFTVGNPTTNDRSNPIKEGVFFYSTTGNSEDYSQTFEFTEGGFNPTMITLDTPYKITGNEEALYFGYSLIIPDREDAFYVVCDGNPTDNDNSCMYGLSNDDSFPSTFKSTGSWRGALCMSITITGDNLPQNRAKLTNLDIPLYLPLTGAGGNLNFTIQNCGANPITSVEVTTTVDDMPDVVETVEVPGIGYNEYADLAVTGIKGKSPGYLKLKMRITKVNGVDYAGSPIYAMAPAYDNGFDMKIVAEEASGTWCGWCPGGIEALEYLKKNYPDRSIAIGVHYGDEMEVEDYTSFFLNYISGFPTVIYNRVYSQIPTVQYSDICAEIDDIVNMLDVPTYGKVDLTGCANENGDQITLTAKTKFSISTEIPHCLSFIIVEDEVGPYRQTNYFSGKGIPMNGWEDKGDKVVTVYNDVARYITKFPGIFDAIPEAIEENVEYEYTAEIPLLSDEGTPVVTKENYRVIAIITGLMDGRIVNACEITMANKLDGVEEIAGNAGITIRGGVGEVLVEGTDVYNVYSQTGYRVLNKNLTPGLYIVTAGEKVEKVIVK